MKPRYQVSEQGLELIMGFEGYRSTAAQLADGRWTIGYGHTKSARAGATVSQADAKILLLYDLTEIGLALQTLIFTPLNQNQIDALASFTFNVGLDNLEPSTVLRKINQGALLEAASAMDLWRRADLQGEDLVVDALVRRRAAEKALFLTPPDGWVPAPSPVVRVKLDQDTLGETLTSAPVEVHAPLDGDLATAERVVAPRLDALHLEEAPKVEGPFEPANDEAPTAPGGGETILEHLQSLAPSLAVGGAAAEALHLMSAPAEAAREPVSHAAEPQPEATSEHQAKPEAEAEAEREPLAEPEAAAAPAAGLEPAVLAEAAPEPESEAVRAFPTASALEAAETAYHPPTEPAEEPSHEAVAPFPVEAAPLEAALTETVAHPEAAIRAEPDVALAQTEAAPAAETPAQTDLDSEPRHFKPVPAPPELLLAPLVGLAAEPVIARAATTLAEPGPELRTLEPLKLEPQTAPSWTSESFRRPTLFPNIEAPVQPNAGLRTPAAAKFAGFEVTELEPERRHLLPLLGLGLVGLAVFALAAFWTTTTHAPGGLVLGGGLALVGIGCVVASVYFLVHWFLGREV